MTHTSRLFLATVTLGCLVSAPLMRAQAPAPSSAEDLVAHHLDSLGDAKARSSAKTRVAQGPVEFKVLVGGAGTLGGKSVLVSDGTKLHFMMKFPNNEYKGEQFIFNGDKTQVSFSTANQTRSALGGFIYVQDAVLRDGLWGGVLSTAWPLLNVEKRKAKISFDGLKKIDGQDLYELRYQPKKSTDLEIRMYFDPATYHHVLTVYSLSIQNGLGGISRPGAGSGSPTPGSLDNPVGSTGPGLSNETASARQQQNRYRLEERFSDFKTVDGLTLPTHYNVHFTQEQQNGRTTVSEWSIQESDLANNQALDARNFDVK